MTADKLDRPLPPTRRRRRRRSLGAEIFARSLADRQVLVRKLVVGEAIGERPRRGLMTMVRQPGSEEGENGAG